KAIDGQAPRGSDAVFVGRDAPSRKSSEDVYSSFVYDATETTHMRFGLGWRRENDESREPDPSTRDEERWLGRFGVETRLMDGLWLESSLARYDDALDTTLGRTVRLDEDEWKLETALRWSPALFGRAPRFTLGFDRRLP